MPSRELDPITRLTTDAVGSPGQRIFYLQAASGLEQVTLVVEKEQVRALAERLTSVLTELAAERPEDPDEVQAAEAGDLALEEPLEPDFRVGQLSLDYDPSRDRFVMIATELPAEAGEEEPDELQDPREVRLWVTRPQLRVLARHGAEVVGRGRPPCPLCGNPLDPTGHVCPAQNGHRPVPA
jgi:uncharacterized repeat protein (TIGR03847 family)